MATRSSCFASGLAAWLAVLIAGCATLPEASNAPVVPSRSVPIIFLDNQPSRPFVELRVGQSVGWFLLDTGAAGHVMSDWFFAAAFPDRAALGRRGFAVDFSGVRIPVTIVSALPTSWADGQFQPLDFSVGSFSRPGEADGMAGIISPQALLELGGSVELDFPGRAMRWWPRPPTRGVEYSLQSRTLQACRASTSGAIVYAWAMAVEGRAVWAMMDTGSPVTAVAPESEPGRLLWPRSRPMTSGMGVSHAPIETRAASSVIDFGGVPWHGEVAIMKLPLADCGTGALVGMNLLRRCSVVVSADRGTVLCSLVR